MAVSATDTKPASLDQGSSGRLMSLDALRGFVMFWIIGGDAQFASLDRLGSTGWAAVIAAQLHHVAWEGLHFYDLIFPLLLFVVGVSLVFSLDRIVERSGKRAAVRRILRRAAAIYLLGVFYDGGIADWRQENILCGVLQRIALCYLLAGLLYLRVRLRGLVVLVCVTLIGYWALLSFVPAPGEPAASFARNHNWSDRIDILLPPYHHRDPEGLLSTFPATCSTILGIFAGLLLKSPRLDERRKARLMFAGGSVLLVLGLLWGLQFPIIKRIWTSSYVLATGGASLLALGLFYTAIERWNRRRWAVPFVWIGANPLTLYMVGNMVDMEGLARRLVGGDLERALGVYGGLLVTATAMGMMLALAQFLYRRRIFLRL